MVDNDFQPFIKMSIICQTIVRQIWSTFSSDGLPLYFSWPFFKQYCESISFLYRIGFIKYYNLQGVGTKTKEDRDGTCTKPSLCPCCLNVTQVSSTNVRALSNVRDIPARTVKVFPKPMSSAIKPPVSIGRLELLMPLILFWNLRKSVYWSYPMNYGTHMSWPSTALRSHSE